uniref:Uncharacterized protein n=1 Tax=Steinernema glaseri TaxID=37863 RepID=A0A1I7ZBG8_9BILA
MGFLQTTSFSPSPAWYLVLLAVTSIASIVPSFWVLSFFHPLVIRLPGDGALAVAIYIARLPFVIIGAITAVTIYVDLVTPVIMAGWATTLKRYAEAVYAGAEDKDTTISEGRKSFLDVSRDSCFFHPLVIRLPGDDALAVTIYIARLPVGSRSWTSLAIPVQAHLPRALLEERRNVLCT